MSQHFNLQIPGVQSDDGQIEVTAPYDGTLIATVTAADADAVELALSTADRLYRDRDLWLKPAKRMEILEKTAFIMSERAEELAFEAAREGGKPLIDSRAEIKELPHAHLHTMFWQGRPSHTYFANLNAFLAHMYRIVYVVSTI